MALSWRALGSLQRSPDSLSGLKGPTSKRRRQEVRGGKQKGEETFHQTKICHYTTDCSNLKLYWLMCFIYFGVFSSPISEWKITCYGALNAVFGDRSIKIVLTAVLHFDVSPLHLESLGEGAVPSQKMFLTSERKMVQFGAFQVLFLM